MCRPGSVTFDLVGSLIISIHSMGSSAVKQCYLVTCSS
jgi:hypothetical protein